jgi:hypothetical protein
MWATFYPISAKQAPHELERYRRNSGEGADDGTGRPRLGDCNRQRDGGIAVGGGRAVAPARSYGRDFADATAFVPAGAKRMAGPADCGGLVVECAKPSSSRLPFQATLRAATFVKSPSLEIRP